MSAPGKTILMGEHAAVYGRPALVAAVDRRLRVSLTPSTTTAVELSLPAVDVETTTDWSALRAESERARLLWNEVAQVPSPEGFRRLRGTDPAFLVRIALGETASWIERRTARRVEGGLTLRVDSDLPVGSGFGSSAAVAVGVAKGLATLEGVELGAADLQRLALDIERRQHGLPSGVDTGAVIHGGVIWTERDATGNLEITPVELASGVLDGIRIVNTGEPTETTGEVVAAVRERWQSDRDGVEALLDRMERATRGLRKLLAAQSASSGPTPGDARGHSGAPEGAAHHSLGREAPAMPRSEDRSMTKADSDSLVTLFRDFEACLESLGVVPESVRGRLRDLEALGGAGKISGAGTLTGSGAGSLLVYHRDPERIAGSIADLPSLDAPLGARGVWVEG